MPEEDRYTLEEARQIFAEKECWSDDHDYDHWRNNWNELVAVTCSRCGKKWAVQETKEDTK